ncbi:MAG: hypothetical protein V2J24_14610 [Pseudomonadales bacterium]|jgi:hypothetical protein|nr:hypothetical protein [Pseudomonadales bacterium]
MQALKLLFSPIVFAIGFLAPLTAQTLDAAGVALDGVPNLALGFAVALTLGTVAQFRGGWLWHSSNP